MDQSLESSSSSVLTTKKVDANGKSAFNLQPHQDEFLQLSDLAGIRADPTVMRIIIELINMQIDPNAIIRILKSMRRTPKPQKRSSSRISTNSQQ